MEIKVLVAYSSKYGATAEIAEKVGQVLKDLKPYNAFVVGSAAYMFRWRADSISFLNKRQNLLAEHPTWLFSSGPLGKGDPVDLLKGERFPKALQPVVDRIRPLDIAVFHGFANMAKMNIFERFFFNKTPDSQGDFRDWEAISSWANGIASSLKK
jgi:menaquinone-dependent protoporphyrinogen oxidase